MSDNEFIGGDSADEFDPDSVARANAKQRVDQDIENATVVKFLERRQEAYRRVFAGSPVGDDVAIVLGDLQAFCRGDATTFDPDPRIHALLTGRQEVFLRIQDHRRLSLEALVEKYTKPPDQQ